MQFSLVEDLSLQFLTEKQLVLSLAVKTPVIT